VNDMDSSDLRVFETVARLGGMGRAAVELNTVQSNVTSHVRRLERELGRPLFRRHPRGVEATPAGLRLLPYAVKITQLLDDARRAASEDGTPHGQLVVGSLETTAAVHLSDKLAAYVAAYPQVDLMLRTGTTCELIEQVVSRKLEGAFVCGPVKHAELTAAPFFAEELVLVTSPRIPSLDELSRGGEVRIVVLRAGCSYRQRLVEVLARRGIPTPRILEFGTLEAVFGCVAAGLGITLLPRALLGSVWREGRVTLHALPARDGLVKTVFVRRRDAVLFAALTAFLAMIRPASSVVNLHRSASQLRRQGVVSAD
jgi:DNA-binding transcriptional LysR family regulator